MTDCLFCKMVSRVIKPDIIYEDDEVLAFRDINPQAPMHVLVVPKRHISTTNDLMPEDAPLLGKMILAAKQVARQENLDASGYRMVMNCNEAAGQSVFHIHLHVLAGRNMTWPPG